MSNEITLNTFPSNRSESLAILHLQRQDISSLSPKELSRLYLKTYKEIRLAFKSSIRDEDGFPSIPE